MTTHLLEPRSYVKLNYFPHILLQHQNAYYHNSKAIMYMRFEI